MFDQANLFSAKRSKFIWLVGQLGTNAGAWQTFTIPRNASWVYMFCLGSGSGGGGGQWKSVV